MIFADINMKQVIRHYRIQVSGQNWFFRTKKEAMESMPHPDWGHGALLYQGCYSCDMDGITYRSLGKEYLLDISEGC